MSPLPRFAVQNGRAPSQPRRNSQRRRHLTRSESLQTSEFGYTLPLEPHPQYVRSSPDSRPPSVNVRNRVDFVRSIFRFGLGGCCRYTGSYDPFQTFEKTFRTRMKSRISCLTCPKNDGKDAVIHGECLMRKTFRQSLRERQIKLFNGFRWHRWAYPRAGSYPASPCRVGI